MPFTILRNDITKIQVDAIVNAANTDLAMGGGVCGAIFKAAGAQDLQAACDKLAPIKTGQAVITDGFALPARHIIHTAGRVYHGDKHGEAELLRACYQNSLALAAEYGCASIAFPLISTGIYGYPKDEALSIARSAIGDFLLDHDMDVTLVVFDKASFALSEALLGEVEAFIDERYVDERAMYTRRRELLPVEKLALEMPMAQSDMCAEARSLADMVGDLDEPFSQTLLRLIDERGKSDTEVYNEANIDRKHFSKIRSNPAYMPSKRTALAFAIALELTLAETADLLARAGFALSRSQKFDVIIEYFINAGKYDIFEINEVLFYYDQPLLGG